MFIEIKSGTLVAKEAIETIELDYLGNTFVRTKSGKTIKSDISYSNLKDVLVVIN